MSVSCACSSISEHLCSETHGWQALKDELKLFKCGFLLGLSGTFC